MPTRQLLRWAVTPVLRSEIFLLFLVAEETAEFVVKSDSAAIKFVVELPLQPLIVQIARIVWCYPVYSVVLQVRVKKFGPKRPVTAKHVFKAGPARPTPTPIIALPRLI